MSHSALQARPAPHASSARSNTPGGATPPQSPHISGGHPDDIMSLSKGLFTSGFTGCIHYMSIMKTLNNGDLNTGGEIEFNNPSLTEVTKGVTCEKMCMA